jgi:hypothetical protein
MIDARLLRMPCAQLLLSQLVLILAFPWLESSIVGNLALDALHLTVIVLVVRAVAHTPGRQLVALTLAAAVVVTQGVYFFSGIADLYAVALVALGLFQAYAVWCLLQYVMLDEVATTDELFAAASIYVLLAMAFACVFSVLEHLAPGSFFINPTNNADGVVNWWDLVYFSFTTLTSVGFGEITPVTSHARSLVMVEQVVGVLFVALLIARLTGIYGRRVRGY